MLVQLRTPNEPNFALHADATYLIAGGFGGLGRAISRWLVNRGARNLILISRSGASKPEAKALVAELESKGVHVKGLACDVADTDRLRRSLDECAQEMPPVAGCIQASMVLTVRSQLFPCAPLSSTPKGEMASTILSFKWQG